MGSDVTDVESSQWLEPVINVQFATILIIAKSARMLLTILILSSKLRTLHKPQKSWLLLFMMTIFQVLMWMEWLYLNKVWINFSVVNHKLLSPQRRNKCQLSKLKKQPNQKRLLVKYRLRLKRYAKRRKK